MTIEAITLTHGHHLLFVLQTTCIGGPECDEGTLIQELSASAWDRSFLPALVLVPNSSANSFMLNKIFYSHKQS